MRASEIIRRKRDGEPVPPEAVAELVAGHVAGTVPDYQMAAFCMAVFFRGMEEDELAALTRAMLESGEILDLSHIPGPKVDKHSTGGVGDKVSLALAPLAAACGVKVPMISGRGLGHTGGTLDKLESIPGFRVDLPVERVRELVASVGACLVGQTERLAPADRRLYALRDVTATVESIPLISASILSKKLAEGIGALVLDVKVGSGAFMKRPEDGRELGRSIIGLARRMGTKVTALLTSMDQPLGREVGNAGEVREAVELLRGGGPPDLRRLTLELTAEMLRLGGLADGIDPARRRVEEAIGDGSGLAKLRQIVEAQGGDPRAVDDPGRLPRPQGSLPVGSPGRGVVQAVDAEAIGLAAMALGAGRSRVEDRIDPGVGLTVLKKVGDPVEPGEPLCTLHYGRAGAEPPPRVADRVRQAYRIGARPVAPPQLLLERID